MHFKIMSFFLLVVKFLYSDTVLSQSQYIWNTGLAFEADVRPSDFYKLFIHPNIYIQPKTLNDCDVIWIQPIYLDYFVVKILPQIKTKFILLLNTCDNSFPTCMKKITYKKLIDSQYLVHIFAQNCLISNHKKITQIPIGLDLHSLAYGKNRFGEQKTSCSDQEKKLNEVKNNTFSQKLIKACVDFKHIDSMKGKNNMKDFFGEDRTEICYKLQNKSCVDFFENKLPRSKLWLKKSAYAFSICPPGNGIDTHRVWEDLILGIIPIVKTTPLDPLYKQFPIVIVDDWNKITQENLESWYKEKSPLFENEEIMQKLNQKYWLDLIASKKFSNLQ
jgi:hypothetical protein